MLYAYFLTKSNQGQYLGRYFRGDCLRYPSADRLTAQRFGNLLTNVTIFLLKDVPIGLRQTVFSSRQGSCTIWGKRVSSWIKYTVWIWCGGLSAWPAWTHDTNPTDLFHVGTTKGARIHSTCQVQRRPYTETPNDRNNGRRQRVKTCSRERRIPQRLQQRNGPRTFVKQALTKRGLWFRFW